MNFDSFIHVPDIKPVKSGIDSVANGVGVADTRVEDVGCLKVQLDNRDEVYSTLRRVIESSNGSAIFVCRQAYIMSSVVYMLRNIPNFDFTIYSGYGAIAEERNSNVTVLVISESDYTNGCAGLDKFNSRISGTYGVVMVDFTGVLDSEMILDAKIVMACGDGNSSHGENVIDNKFSTTRKDEDNLSKEPISLPNTNILFYCYSDMDSIDRLFKSPDIGNYYKFSNHAEISRYNDIKKDYDTFVFMPWDEPVEYDVADIIRDTLELEKRIILPATWISSMVKFDHMRVIPAPYEYEIVDLR